MVNDLTIEKIRSNQGKFTPELFKTLETLIDFSTNYSPMSDLLFISSKLDVTFNGLIYPSKKNSWVPVRNTLRLIARMVDQELSDEIITEIRIEDMLCGCDYFKGYATYLTNKGILRGGNYKWQWTAFPGYDKHYNKFIEFDNSIIGQSSEIFNLTQK